MAMAFFASRLEPPSALSLSLAMTGAASVLAAGNGAAGFFYFLAHIEGALTSLFDDLFLPMRRQARKLGWPCGRAFCAPEVYCSPLRNGSSLPRRHSAFLAPRVFTLSACDPFRRSSSTGQTRKIWQILRAGYTELKKGLA
jgi:hypothetical protein